MVSKDGTDTDIQQLEQTSNLTVQVYVRPGMLLEPLDAKIATLQRLEADDVIEAVTIQAWPDKVPLSDTTPYTEVVDLFDRFTLWADRHDVSITPPFGVRTQSTLTSEDTRRVLSTPMMCLAVYNERTLAAVYPHADGNEQYSVTDAIAALRTGEIDRLTPQPDLGSATVEPLSRHCPACDGPLVNIQGVRACQDCTWSDHDTTLYEPREIDSVAH